MSRAATSQPPCTSPGRSLTSLRDPGLLSWLGPKTDLCTYGEAGTWLPLPRLNGPRRSVLPLPALLSLPTTWESGPGPRERNRKANSNTLSPRAIQRRLQGSKENGVPPPCPHTSTFTSHKQAGKWFDLCGLLLKPLPCWAHPTTGPTSGIVLQPHFHPSPPHTMTPLSIVLVLPQVTSSQPEP